MAGKTQSKVSPRIILGSAPGRMPAGSGHAMTDCPLPELYRHLKNNHPGLTLGQFHDLVRGLYADRKIYLHPWTGPLYERCPNRPGALLAGHEVVYYASLGTPLAV